MFVHLNTHSVFSRMRGTAAPRELVAHASARGMTHLALTEVNGLWGFIRFVQFAKDHGILPIAGVNLITETDDIVLLVENQSGYENLCQVISRVHDDPGQSLKALLKHRCSGLFALAHQPQTLKQLSRFLQDTHLFVELRPGTTERQALQLSRKFKLEIVVTGDVYFIRPEDQKTHKVLRAIDKNATLSQLTPADFKDERHYFQTEKDLIRQFPNSLEALNNAQYLAERCKTNWNYVNTIFPEMSLKDTRNASERLRKLVYSGARLRFGEITRAVNKRIEYELYLITHKGFAPYFLVVHDIVKRTKATIGRGSGAASIVSYCLFITQVDPLKYNLQFERFIHPERVDMPDIDIDFPWDERDGILDYVFKKYGTARTAMVASQVFMQPRSAVREVSKVYGLSNEEIKAVTKRIGWGRRYTQLTKWIQSDDRFKNLSLDDTLLEILEQSEKIIGAFRYPSVHPGGVIIVPDEIRKYVPVLTAPKGVQIVEWEKDQVEDSGLLKIDLLGNRSLAVVRDTLKQIGVYNSDYMDYHKIQPVGDRKTRALMKAGRTMGVFYIESPATRQLLAKAGIVDFEHVVIYSSIIRPAANRFTNLMLERIHGKPWQLPHPDLHFLKESYGIMVYEEQVSMTAREMAGFGYAEADYLRKVISRPSLSYLVPHWRAKFIKGMLKRGHKEKLARDLWAMVQSFSGYSFCKPHSASYAMLSFTCAYLKAHYPAEFLSSVITNQGGFYGSYAYMSEARRFGIKILLPDINRSARGYRGRKDRMRIGFAAIKNLQEKTVTSILDERKAGEFTSLNDFFLRVELDLADAMALTNAGCFAALAPDLTHKEIAFRVACLHLQNGRGDSLPPPANRMLLTRAERMKLEIESFGFPVTEHPLSPYLSYFSGRIKKARDIPRYVGQTINLAGVYITRKVTATRKHEAMEFVTFEDETDIYECVMFPNAFAQYGDLLNWEKLFILRGKVEEAFGVYTLTIEKLSSLQRMIKRLYPRHHQVHQELSVGTASEPAPDEIVMR
ncbi:MAG: DNA polymerase III subunit alpha [FCB group bacterium]|nr:DNA polymerase III subunit alpha [FCB group bacterium]